MKKVYSLLLGITMVAALGTGFAAIENEAGEPVESASTTNQTVQKDAYAPTLTELILEKLESTDQNVISVAYNQNVYLSAEVMQALQDASGKALVVRELRGKTPLWKLTIRSEDVTAQPAKSFKPSMSFTQNKQNGAITIVIGKPGIALNAKVMVSIPLVNTTLDKDVALDADNLILWKFNTETQRWDKSQALVKVDENDMLYFYTASGGTYYVGNSAPTRKP